MVSRVGWVVEYAVRPFPSRSSISVGRERHYSQANSVCITIYIIHTLSDEEEEGEYYNICNIDEGTIITFL